MSIRYLNVVPPHAPAFRLHKCLACLFLLLVLLGQSLPSRAQRGATEPAATAADLSHLLPALGHLSEAEQVDQLLTFMDNLVATGRFEEAEATVREALRIARTSRQRVLLCRVELSQGYLATQLADYAEALRHYQRSLELARLNRDYRRQARALIYIASLSDQSHNWPQANQALQQALQLTQAHQLPALQASVYGDLANLAGMQKHPAEALAYGTKALHMHQAIHDTSAYYSTLLNQSITYKNLGQYAQSARGFRQVMAYAQRVHDDYLLGYVQVNFPRTLLLLQQPGEAERYGLQALQWVRKTRDLAILHEVYDLLAAVKEKQGQYQSALAYQRKAVSVQDSLFNQQKNQQLLTTEARYRSKAQQARIVQLGADNTRKQRQLAALLGGLALIGTLALVLWRSNRQRQRANQLLERQKGELQTQKVALQTQRDQTTQALVELRTAQAQLVQQEKLASVGQLAKGIVDRLLNPLNYITNFLQASDEVIGEIGETLTHQQVLLPPVLDDLQDGLSFLKTNSVKIQEHSHSTTRILKDMQKLLKEKSHDFIETDLNRFLETSAQTTLKELRPDYPTLAVRLVFDAAAQPVHVGLLPFEFGQLVQSLVSNACYTLAEKSKATKDFTPELRLSTRLAAGQAVVRVRDNGKGIAAQEVPKLFSPFFTTKPTSKGTGLGLYMAKDIVEVHQGNIEIDTLEGEFTEITLTLPALNG